MVLVFGEYLYSGFNLFSFQLSVFQKKHKQIRVCSVALTGLQMMSFEGVLKEQINQVYIVYEQPNDIIWTGKLYQMTSCGGVFPTDMQRNILILEKRTEVLCHSYMFCNPQTHHLMTLLERENKSTITLLKGKVLKCCKEMLKSVFSWPWLYVQWIND